MSDDGNASAIEQRQLARTGTSSSSSGSPLKRAKLRLDHLGQPIQMKGSHHYRYTRTYTMIYDGAGSQDRAAAEKTWRLLLDAQRSVDLSSGGLQRLY